MPFHDRPTLRHAALAVLCAAALNTLPAAAATTATKFEPSLEVQGTKLQLNGAGTRYRAVFKVYDMGLYTTKKVSTPAEVLALPGTKRLQFTALRELPGTDLGRLFLKGMSENSTKDEMQRQTIASTRLIDVFSGRSKMLPGESFAMEYVPGKGTTFYILGKAQGEPVGDAEFFALVLKIWFGESPADRLLMNGLLGRD
jgi:hypothetical protein